MVCSDALALREWKTQSKTPTQPNEHLAIANTQDWPDIPLECRGKRKKKTILILDKIIKYTQCKKAADAPLRLDCP